MKKIITLALLSICFSLMVSHAKAFAETIKIASIFAKTGVAAKNNALLFEGVRFAVSELSKQGGLLGKKLELYEYDNMSSSIGSKVAATKAVNEGVIGVIGASWSSHSLGMAPVLQKSGTVMISPTSTNPKVTRVGNYIFRACFIDPFQGKIMALFAQRELQAKTAAILKDVRSDYSMGLFQVFKENFIKNGGSILLELDYKQKQRDFRKQLTQIKEIGPDVLFIPGHDDSGFIAKQAQNIGISAVPLGTDGWDNPNFLKKGGNDLQKAYFSTHWSMDVKSEKSQSFVKRYLQQSDTDKLSYEPLAYDAVMLLADAIRRANSLDRGKIREALAQTENFEGVSGVITFDENGDPSKSAVIMEIVDGAFRYYKSFQPQ